MPPIAAVREGSRCPRRVSRRSCRTSRSRDRARGVPARLLHVQGRPRHGHPAALDRRRRHLALRRRRHDLLADGPAARGRDESDREVGQLGQLSRSCSIPFALFYWGLKYRPAPAKDAPRAKRGVALAAHASARRDPPLPGFLRHVRTEPAWRSSCSSSSTSSSSASVARAPRTSSGPTSFRASVRTSPSMRSRAKTRGETPGRTAATAAALMIGIALVTFVAVLANGMKASNRGAIEDQVKADYVVTAQDGFTPFVAGAGDEIAKLAGCRGRRQRPRRPGQGRRRLGLRDRGSTRGRSSRPTRSTGRKATTDRPEPRRERGDRRRRSSPRTTTSRSATRSRS